MLDTTASSIFTTIFPSASSTLFFLGSWLEGGGHRALWEAKYERQKTFLQSGTWNDCHSLIIAHFLKMGF